jgi:hypothetical protein
MLPVRRTRAALVLVVALLAALVVTGSGPAAQAADDQGLVNGAIRFPQHDKPGLKMLWFDRNWGYVGQRSLGRVDGYSIWLKPGTYHLQFVDQRPAYDVTKYAPTDIQVTVRADDITTKSVTLRAGAAITGTARAGGKALGGARLVAANRAEQSFATTANKKGQFAIGGLPQGQYSVFTYDKRKTWVGKSAWAGAVTPGQVKNLAIRLTKKAGSMTVYLFTPQGRLRARTSVTVTSKQSGQWWTATARNGTAVFKGLYPGRYTLKFDGAGVWFARTGNVQRATVKPARIAFGKFDITTRGGWVTGTAVDGDDATFPMSGVKVALWNSDGSQVASTTSDAEGRFKLQGQLATQSGLAVVVTPRDGDDSWMQGAEWCMFTSGTASPFSLTTGERTEVGEILLPRSTVAEQPERCLD